MTPEGAPHCCPPEMVVMRHESIRIRPPENGVVGDQHDE